MADVLGRPRLLVNGVTKRFGGVPVLTDVSCSLRAGRVLCLVGENGAGKSTLVNILSGLVVPDRGTVELDGVPLRLGEPRVSLRRGIGVVHQELTLFPNLSVAENVFLGHEPVNRTRRIDRKMLSRMTTALLGGWSARIDPEAELGGLSLADQAAVEVAKAMAWNPIVLILDEATSALGGDGVARLFSYLRLRVAAGLSVIFVSHRMPELFEIGDEAVVLRDGVAVKSVGELAGVTPASLAEAIVGRPLKTVFPTKCVGKPSSPVLEVSHLCGAGVRDASVAVHGGEIVGLGGLSGHGQSALLRLLFGVSRIEGGTVEVDGKRLEYHSTRGALAGGIGFVPKDRKSEGLLLPLAVETNLTLSVLATRLAGRVGLIRQRAERDLVAELRERLLIRQTQWRQAAGSLSGGNQQKVLLGKWVARGSHVLLLDEPTRGVDVGTRVEVYKLLRELSNSGMGILLVSAEGEELLGLCDRVYVFYEGRAVRELRDAEMTDKALTFATLGVSAEVLG